jgi:signal transduction histidine kinase
VITIEGDFEECPVLMSPIEIEQVLVNLIRNAIESRPEAAAVIIRLRQEQGLATIEVEDNGAGLAKDAVAHIFDPFFTSRLRVGGTGLGLSVAHGIILGHGGTITVDSEYSTGTRMRIELPVARLVGESGD